MATGTVKASTQDSTNGTPVAVAVNEDGTGAALQVFVAEGHKSTYTEQARTAITAADAPTGGDLTATGFAGTAGANLFDLGNALSCHVRATCDTAGATLTAVLVLYDAANNPLAYTRTATFTSDGTLRLGNAAGNFVSPHDILDVGGARKARLLVKSVSAGTWAVYARPV